MTKAAIYIRVSTKRQEKSGYSLGIQEGSLKRYVKDRGWTIHRIYRDSKTGTKIDGREGLKKMLDAASRDMFDILLVYRCDRISRKVEDKIKIVNLLKKHKVGLVSYTEPIDTTTPVGRLQFHMNASIAEYERDLISERTKRGMQEAKRKGKHVGRPKKS